MIKSHKCFQLIFSSHMVRGPRELLFDLIFKFFHLGTSRAFSAIQRYRFVHGHVHILIPMPWGHRFSLIFAFSTWGPLVPSARFSAISLSMDMFIFSHYHDFIIMSQLQCHDDHIVRGILRSFWMHFGGLVGEIFDHFGVMLRLKIFLDALWELCSCWKWFSRAKLRPFWWVLGAFQEDFQRHFCISCNVKFAIGYHLLLR